ncbi:MAG: PEP-CTERM sorting domain-containing protein [Alphaproteobacteria bacterium]|nr:PEP-CTERM sorting domain-containing protein [Alphaproteobacteria bacterium]
MKKLMAAAAISLMSLASAGSHALPLAFFDNGTYTDPTRESALLATSLGNLGHTTSSFSGIAAADWTAATAGKSALIIPELDNNPLHPDLDAGARTSISSYVSGGGALLMFDRSGGESQGVLNDVFGYSIAGGTTSGPLALNAGAGAQFLGGPASLPYADATETFDLASLPAGAVSVYDDGTSTAAFFVPFGAGYVAWLAFDWFESPTPAEWEEVLGRMLDRVAGPSDTPVPVPATALLFGSGLLALAGLRRRSR